MMVNSEALCYSVSLWSVDLAANRVIICDVHEQVGWIAFHCSGSTLKLRLLSLVLFCLSQQAVAIACGTLRRMIHIFKACDSNLDRALISLSVAAFGSQWQDRALGRASFASSMASSINLDMLASASPQLIAMLKGKIEEAERE